MNERQGSGRRTEPTVTDLLIEVGARRFLAATLYLPAVSSEGASTVPAPKPPGLIVAHGAGSNRRRHDPFCRMACAFGLAVLSFDFRGHGESSGLLDGPAENDILAAAAFLRADRRVNGERLAFRGSSMGGYYGLRAAPHAEFSALALLCPATEQILLEAMGAMQGCGERSGEGLCVRYDADGLRAYLARSDLFADAAATNTPVLFVHARGDTVVPLDNSLRLAGLLRGPAEMVILPDGSHSSAQSSPEIHRRVAAWLASRLSEA